MKDVTTGEPLERVSVSLEGSGQTLTGAGGTFTVSGVAPGTYKVRISTVGYHMYDSFITVTQDETRSITVLLPADTLVRRDSIEVRADPFDFATRSSPTDFSIEGNEIKNLANVLADDPLRSVHSMPAVASNDDFEGRFSLHGAPYSRVGLYLDGVLLHEPFHTVNGEGPSGSMAVFNGDLVDSMTLHSEGYAAEYGDRTAGILDVKTRDGDRDRVRVAATAGVANAGVRAEGPLGGGKGSWLASYRKSYMQYLLQRTSDQPTMAFGFEDLQASLSYDLGKSHRVKLEVIDGTSAFNRKRWVNQLGLNAAALAGFRTTVANVGWQYMPAPTLRVESHAAFLRERFDDTNRNGSALGAGFYGEWIGNSTATWMWNGAGALTAGFSIRRIRGAGFNDYYSGRTARVRTDEHGGTALLTSGYAQQNWSAFSKRVELSAGVRWDRHEASGQAIASPQGSVAFLPWRSGRVQLAWGQYAQFPGVDELFARYGRPTLRAERATHFVAALEQRLGEMSRLRIQVYQRNDRDLLFRPTMEARVTPGGIAGDDWQAPIENSMRGYAKGAEIFVQRRTANRLTGWASYALGYARMRDGWAGQAFPSDQDQRHTANVYLGYRVRPSVHLSTKWSYGSGFPIPGYFKRAGDTYYLAAERNGARLDPYQRLDIRINKSRNFDRWKMTIYGEVVNLLNRTNYRFDSYNGYSAKTGQAYLSFSSMFPVLPAAGIMLDF